MQNKKYAMLGLCMLGIAFAYTIYTVLVVSGLFDNYDDEDDKITIRIEPRTIIYYLIAACFVTSVVYRLYERGKRKTKILNNIGGNGKGKGKDKHGFEFKKIKDPYSDLVN